ncbi:unnamed protein product [Psylliodes chrysocephalus]|uniref:Saposin B-type domain-containing protein n=1 Tax=Psylliodes chrysocephalus TaxID=3402493 RepID=A0A9P0G8F9_9CUCU|nr:unnamed protein product [Psylliodes chrysocephala]
MKCLGLWIFFLAAISLTYAANKPNCKSCLTVAEVGKDILSSGVTDDELKSIGDILCASLPTFARSFCPSTIQTVYQNLRKQFVVKKTTPQTVCTKVKMC